MGATLNFAGFLFGLAGMEAVAWATHRFLMHGPLWSLHRSHHGAKRGAFEANDLFGVLFAMPSILLIWVGTFAWRPALWLGLGMAAYGLVYLLFHDALVHQRFGYRRSPRNRYLKRLVQAHRLHHAVHSRDGCVSFGFLYAPDIRRLKSAMAERHARLDQP